jgi:hypothetical protein
MVLISDEKVPILLEFQIIFGWRQLIFSHVCSATLKERLTVSIILDVTIKIRCLALDYYFTFKQHASAAQSEMHIMRAFQKKTALALRVRSTAHIISSNQLINL